VSDPYNLDFNVKYLESYTYNGILIGTYTCPLINSVISHDLE